MVIEQSTQSRVIEEGMHMSSCIAHHFAGHDGYVMGDILLSMKKFDERYHEMYRKKNLKLTAGLLEAIGFTKQVAQNGVVSYTTRIPGNEKYIKRFCNKNDIEYAMKHVKSCTISLRYIQTDESGTGIMSSTGDDDWSSFLGLEANVDTIADLEEYMEFLGYPIHIKLAAE